MAHLGRGGRTEASGRRRGVPAASTGFSGTLSTTVLSGHNDEPVAKIICRPASAARGRAVSGASGGELRTRRADVTRVNQLSGDPQSARAGPPRSLGPLSPSVKKALLRRAAPVEGRIKSKIGFSTSRLDAGDQPVDTRADIAFLSGVEHGEANGEPAS